MPAITVRGGANKGGIGYFNRTSKFSLHFRPPHLQHQNPTATGTSTGGPTESSLEDGTFRGEATRTCYSVISSRLLFQLSVLLPLGGLIVLIIGLFQINKSDSHFVLIFILSGLLIISGILIIIFRFILLRSEQEAAAQEVQLDGQPTRNRSQSHEQKIETSDHNPATKVTTTTTTTITSPSSNHERGGIGGGVE